MGVYLSAICLSAMSQLERLTNLVFVDLVVWFSLCLLLLATGIKEETEHGQAACFG
jgi:hypothetical protein